MTQPRLVDLWCRERLCLLSSDGAIDMDSPPNLPAIWSDRREGTSVLNTNVVAVVAQVNMV